MSCIQALVWITIDRQGWFCDWTTSWGLGVHFSLRSAWCGFIFLAFVINLSGLSLLCWASSSLGKELCLVVVFGVGVGRGPSWLSRSIKSHVTKLKKGMQMSLPGNIWRVLLNQLTSQNLVDMFDNVLTHQSTPVSSSLSVGVPSLSGR